jgi:hypothetical protein
MAKAADATPSPDGFGSFTGPFFQEVAYRKQQDRDAKIIITARDGQTGVGKTSCAVFLAKLFDTSGDGFNSRDKATLDIPEFLAAYDELEEGSALILDEAEQLDARRSMSNQNVDAAYRWQTRRVRQIISLLTLPAKKDLDTRMERLADYWVLIEARGRATVYKSRIQRARDNEYYEKMQQFEWPSMDYDYDYRILERLKDEHIDAPEQSDEYVHRDEVQDLIDDAVSDAKQEKRDAIISNLDAVDVKRAKIAEAVGLSNSRVRDIINN